MAITITKGMGWEDMLVEVAQWSNNDEAATKALERLRSDYDETYHYCTLCNGSLVKDSECCMNRKSDLTNEEF